MRRFAAEALAQAQRAAFGTSEYAEQESFVRASEIRTLAERAGIGPGISVLDLCCGIAGPGRFLTRELGCAYLGVDASEDAIAIARQRTGDLPCRFVVAQIPPLPQGFFEVVLLLETMLAFRDKRALLAAVARTLPDDGRFAFTLEEGAALTESEQTRMPAADTVWLVPLEEMHTLLARVGLAVSWQEDWSESHRTVAESLTGAYAANATTIASRIGESALEELLHAHRQWSEWLTTGRVRKFALVAERSAKAAATVMAEAASARGRADLAYRQLPRLPRDRNDAR